MELIQLTKRAIRVISDTYNNGDLANCMMIRSGDASGRTVPHFHIHIIPRKRIGEKNGKPEYELIYEKTLSGEKRPFLDSIEKEVKMLRRGFDEPESILKCHVQGDDKPAELDQHLRKKIFYESEYFVVLHHPDPIMEGHSLIVPKRDISSMLQINSGEAEDLAKTYAKIMSLLIGTYGDDTRSYITTAQAGGYQCMPIDRLHIHLVVRKHDDAYEKEGDRIYYDLFEREASLSVISDGDIQREVARLKRLV